MVSSTKIPSLQMARCFSRSLTPRVNVLWWHLPWRFSGKNWTTLLLKWIFVNLRKGPDTTWFFLLGSKLCQKFVCKHIMQFGGSKVDDNSRLWSPFGSLVELEMRMEEMLKHFMRWMYASKATLKKVNICEYIYIYRNTNTKTHGSGANLSQGKHTNNQWQWQSDDN